MIGIIGPIGVSDLGDVAIFCETMEILAELAPRETFATYFLNNPGRNLRQITRLRYMQEGRYRIGGGKYNQGLGLSYLDGLLFTAGAYFNSVWGEALYSEFLLPLLILKNQVKNIPVILGGNNLGPFNKKDESFLKETDIFWKVTAAALRDKHVSPKYLDIELSFFPDPGIYAQPSNKPKPERPYVLLNIHNMINDLNTYNQIVFLCWRIFSTTDFDIRLVPFSSPADYKAGLKLKKRIRDKRLILHEPDEDYHNLVADVKYAEAVVSMRLHPIVFALAQNRPSIALVTSDLYKQKMHGIYDILGVHPNTIDLREKTKKELWSLYQGVGAPGEKIFEKIKDLREQYIEFLRVNLIERSKVC